MSDMKIDLIEDMDVLVLHERGIPRERKMLRHKGPWGVILVEHALAQAIAAAGFSGVGWLSIDAYAA